MYNTYNSSLKDSDQMISSVPSLVRIEPERAQNCHICRKYQGQLYPCRVCGKVYHQQCIKDMGNTKSYHLIKNTIGFLD
jgi:hypothetical protein